MRNESITAAPQSGSASHADNTADMAWFDERCRRMRAQARLLVADSRRCLSVAAIALAVALVLIVAGAAVPLLRLNSPFADSVTFQVLTATVWQIAIAFSGFGVMFAWRATKRLKTGIEESSILGDE